MHVFICLLFDWGVFRMTVPKNLDLSYEAEEILQLDLR